MSWDFTKNTWDMFALCFLMHYNNIQQSPKSFCLFNYLSGVINSVESKRRTNRKIIIHPFLKELHEVTDFFNLHKQMLCCRITCQTSDIVRWTLVQFAELALPDFLFTWGGRCTSFKCHERSILFQVFAYCWYP